MAVLLLPVHSDTPFYDFSTEIEGASYTFEFRWNERMGAWFFSLSGLDGNRILSGRRVALGANLLGSAPDIRKPPGSLVAIDSTNQNLEAGREDLGDRVQLYYVEAAELG